uniref:ATP synthase F0 subunit 8 n=1 Tax=Megalodontes quinquecinctus TaxID=2491145 RepID=A0A3Q8UA56_9HYME|nr:ATP synthase F0 subunit 8 [Megalodontes quinquecinctus]
MPQMFPMNWINLLFYITLSLLIIIIMTYYMKINDPSKKK